MHQYSHPIFSFSAAAALALLLRTYQQAPLASQQAETNEGIAPSTTGSSLGRYLSLFHSPYICHTPVRLNCPRTVSFPHAAKVPGLSTVLHALSAEEVILANKLLASPGGQEALFQGWTAGVPKLIWWYEKVGEWLVLPSADLLCAP